MPVDPIKASFNQPFYRAVEELKKRGVVLPDKYYGEFQGLHRQLNFSIAGKASLDQLKGVLDSIEKAMTEGSTFEKWQKDIRVQDLGLPKHRLDNIFRTNIQAAYNRGHWENFVTNKKNRPYLMYDAINDSRVRPSHLAMDGIIRAVGDSFWNSNYPQNGFRCRCRCISLNERQARERSTNGSGLNKPIDDSMTPDKGWDYNVGKDLTAGVNNSFDDTISKMKAGKLKNAAIDYRAKTPEPVLQFTPAQTVKEAEKYLIENNIVDHADFGKITDMTLINNWNKALFDTIKEFPELRINQQFTGSMQAQIELLKSRISNIDLKANGIAWSSNIIPATGIAFNELYEFDITKIISAASKSKYWAKGAESVKYIVDHELGHQFTKILDLTNNPVIIATFEKLKTEDLIAREVSIYAQENSENEKEFISECWAEFRNSKKPRDTARIIGEIIIAEYSARFEK